MACAWAIGPWALPVVTVPSAGFIEIGESREEVWVDPVATIDFMLEERE